jgi:hypothetical protein
MGIPHLEDLPLDKLLRVLDEPWVASEKLDGSFMAFGLDEQGNFYTRRKGDQLCYSVEDWPNMPWCNSFRCAHSAAQAFMDALCDADLGLQAPFEFEAEILWGRQPNTVTYGHGPDSFIVITGGNNRDYISAALLDTFFKDGACVTTTPIWHTTDGVELTQRMHEDRWHCISLDPFQLDTHLSRPVVDLLVWLNKPHKNWEDARIKDILAVNLNRRPEFVPENLWKSAARDVLKAQLKAQREFGRQELVWQLNRIKDAVLYEARRKHLARTDASKMDASGMGRETEGIVCHSLSGVVFKITPRADFAEANLYSHWVRYALQGGRRPARPSFLSRTKHWPIPQRLARLDVLRRRYLDNKTYLGTTNNSYRVWYESDELNQRTLLLFAELRVRIQDGW